MKKVILSLALFVLSNTIIFAAIDTTIANSKINDVTVFFSGAQINRLSDISLIEGKQFFLIKYLPQEINQQSIQVNQLKNSKILSVKHYLYSENESNKSADQLLLEKRNKEIEFKLKEINNKVEAYKIEEQLLLDNSRIMGKSNGSSLSELKETTQFYRDKINEIKKEKLILSTLFDDLIKEIQDNNKKVNELVSKKRKTYSYLLIAVECSKPTKDKLSFSYFVPNAGWEPIYDFRVDDVSKPLSIVYNANVYHTTGENWENVNITLSSSNPTLDGNKPTLLPWYAYEKSPYEKPLANKYSDKTIFKGKVYDAETNEILPFANVTLYKNNEQISGTVSDLDGAFMFNPIQPGRYDIKVNYIGYEVVNLTNFTISPNVVNYQDIKINPQQIELASFEVVEYNQPLISRDDVSSGGTINSQMISQMPGRTSSKKYKQNEVDKKEEFNFIANSIDETTINLAYKIDIPYSIPSDGENYSIKIKEVSLPVEYIYHAVPKLDKDVFLSAIITDWNSLNLLSGKTSIYYQGTFTSESYIDVNEVSDSLVISLGRDKNIIINREGNKMLNDKKSIGNYTKETVAWDITVKNNKNIPITIIIEDQHPISARKTYEVELIEASNAEIDEKTGFLKWNLKLEPLDKKVINFNYTIKFPKN